MKKAFASIGAVIRDLFWSIYRSDFYRWRVRPVLAYVRKALVYTYVIIGVIGVPVLIGGAVGHVIRPDFLNGSRHWGFRVVVCLASAVVATWFPMIFLSEPRFLKGHRFLEECRFRLIFTTLLAAVGGLLGPLLFGFELIGLILCLLVLYSITSTFRILSDAMKDILKDLDETREERDRMDEALREACSPPSGK